MGTFLLYYKIDQTELHHGACVGVDEQAALFGRSLGFQVIAHPPENPKLLSKVSLAVSDKILPALSYLERDREIVHRSGLLIAVPNTNAETPRSGTWYTYKYAQGKDKTLMLVLPDGTVQ